MYSKTEYYHKKCSSQEIKKAAASDSLQINELRIYSSRIYLLTLNFQKY